MSEVLLDVRNLTKYFQTPRGTLHAVDGVSFTIEKGKVLGIVGESGCGKSTTGRAILRLHEPTSGEVYFNGKDVVKADKKEMKQLRRDMQLIFQDPFASLDPRMAVNELIREPLVRNHITKGRAETEKRVKELMDLVGLAERLYNAYPHELDGGRRQRIGIARALAMEPKLIVCDEPVSALDVSIQAQVINLLAELQEELGLTYIFITHDLSVVYYFADDIAVMYLGKLVEKAPAEELFKNPVHPYTKALLSAIPIPVLGAKKDRIVMRGEITSPINLPDACRFNPRCDFACEACKEHDCALEEISPGHFVACHRWKDFV